MNNIIMSTSAGGAGAGLVNMLPLIAIFFLGYWLLLRPQMKRMKAHEAMQAAIARGDKVVTNGGLVGKVTKVGDEELIVTIAPDNTKMTVRRSMIALVVNPKPANDQDAKSKK